MFQPEKLREAIFKARLNVSKLAQMSGVSRNTIGEILKGKNDPRVSTLEAIAKPLGVQASYFFDQSA